MFRHRRTFWGAPARLLLAATFLLLGSSLVGQTMTPGADPAPTVPQTKNGYVAITPKQRLTWFVQSTAGVESLLFAGPFSAGWGTAFHHPKEYNTSWEGFGQRYGMRLTGVSTGNAMEASLGALWGEDPRYFRALGQPFGSRIGNIIKMTFLARNSDGGTRPAYARFIAIPGNNYLSNTWRANHEATAGDASVRVAIGFLGRMGGNAFSEFWPDVKEHLFHKKSSSKP